MMDRVIERHRTAVLQSTHFRCTRFGRNSRTSSGKAKEDNFKSVGKPGVFNLAEKAQGQAAVNPALF